MSGQTHRQCTFPEFGFSTSEEAALGVRLPAEEHLRIALELIRMWAPKDRSPLRVGFSGGKDSIVTEHLCRRAGVSYEARLSVTTIDPPELMRFVKAQYPGAIWDRPKRPFLQALPMHTPPTRGVRWCCKEFKEAKSPSGSTTAVGVRWAESARRKSKWRQFQVWNGRTVICPILYWPTELVWDYIRGEGLPYPSLYDEGWPRLGCVGCPMSDRRLIELERWPAIASIWRRGLRGAWERWNANGRPKDHGDWPDPEAMWRWWLNDHDDNGGECDGPGLFT